MKTFFSQHRLAILGGFFLLFLLIVLSVIIIERRKPIEQPLTQKIHYYGNPSIPIERIRVKTVYAIPEGAAPNDAWQELLDSAFKKIGRFHQLQFLGKSSLVLDVHTEPLKIPDANSDASLESLYKSVQDAIRANPGAFSHFIESAPNEYVVVFILFEGNGADAKKNSFLVGRELLAARESGRWGESILYHEFARTLGLPELYDKEKGSSDSEGIMGLGKFRPLELNFIETALTRKMGLLE